MVTLLLGAGGIWILPMLFLGWLLHKPVDLAWRDFFATAAPRLRRRGMRLNALMILVLASSIDAACTVAMAPKEFAFVFVAADFFVLGTTMLLATLLALSPRQCVALVVVLSLVGLTAIWNLLRVYAI
jgi:hypothetical protein